MSGSEGAQGAAGETLRAREVVSEIITHALIHCPLRPITFEDVAMEAVIVAALARVEAETRREVEDERAALRAVLTPLRELTRGTTRPPWVVRLDEEHEHDLALRCEYGEKDGWPAGKGVVGWDLAYMAWGGHRVANAALIVAAVNAVSALLNALAPEAADARSTTGEGGGDGTRDKVGPR